MSIFEVSQVLAVILICCFPRWPSHWKRRRCCCHETRRPFFVLVAALVEEQRGGLGWGEGWMSIKMEYLRGKEEGRNW